MKTFYLREVLILVTGFAGGLSTAKYVGWDKDADEWKREAASWERAYDQTHDDLNMLEARLFAMTKTDDPEIWKLPKGSGDFLRRVFSAHSEQIIFGDREGRFEYWGSPNASGSYWMHPKHNGDPPRLAATAVPDVPLHAHIVEGRESVILTRVGIFILPRNHQQGGWPYSFVYSRKQNGMLLTHAPIGTHYVGPSHIGLFWNQEGDK